SGGLDSTVLLQNLSTQPTLINKLVAVHINHGLSINAFQWQSHCQQFCKELGIQLIVKQVDFSRLANIEEAARKARYQAFAALLSEEDCLILAHHLDDQAETLLLQLFRGAGVDGLAAMPARKKFAEATLLRPYLKFSRQNLEDYAKAHQLEWIDDESNQNLAFSRNYLRQKILPLIGSRWPAVVRNLVRTTQHCQQAQSNLEALAKIDCPELKEPSTTLALASLSGLDRARIANVLRFWFKLNKVKMPGTLSFNRLITEMIEAKNDARPLIAWKGYCVRRYQHKLYLMQDKEETVLSSQVWTCFPKPLVIEGLGKIIVREVAQGFLLPGQSQIEIRFRQGGELFNWHGQNKQLKKLLQEWQVPTWLRDRIPLFYINGQLAIVVGYAVSDLFFGESAPNSSPLELELSIGPIIK
ncbi:MAG: tRNA lysidine(34) synthetase TilS, partial [Tatlockia sp.]|nr:tRNA lysidine(34) synthetase TilS [Tatlockia sp.]